MNWMRCLIRRALWVALWALSVVLPITGVYADNDAKGSLPTLKTVGVVPVQVQHTLDFPLEWHRPLEFITANFAGIVRGTERFRVLNDEIVTDLWKNPAGRKELMDRFEMDAFVSLTITPKQDVIRFVVRLIAPDFSQNYLVEEESLSQVWLATSEEGVIEGFLKDLTFRLINRLPVDVFVTSLQGPYITLSGGENQNIFPGDTVTLYDTKITSIHPANGSWLTYEQKKLGKARIIESKKLAAVAEISYLSYEGAIFLGSGAKIDALNSRVRFHRAAQKPEFREPNDVVLIAPEVQKGVIATRHTKDAGPKVASAADVPILNARGDDSKEVRVPPPEVTGTLASETPSSAVDALSQASGSVPVADEQSPKVQKRDDEEKAAPEPQASSQSAPPPNAQDTAEKESPATSQEPAPSTSGAEGALEPGATPAAAASSANEAAAKDSSPQKSEAEEIDDRDEAGKNTLLGPFLKKFEEKEATLSSHMLGVSAPASTSSKLPTWIFNDIAARGRIHYKNKLSADYLGFLRIGPTSNGTMSGLGVESRLLYSLVLDQAPFGARTLHVGPVLHLESLGISGEKYGGVDLLSLGVTGEIDGGLAFGDERQEDQAFWRLHAAYVPLAVGSIGIKGTKKSLGSFANLAVDGTLFLAKKKADRFQWGGALGLSTGAAKGGTTSLTISDLFLGVSLR